MKTPEFVQRLFVELGGVERRADAALTRRAAEKLAAKMPTYPQDRQMYVANMLRDAVHGKISREVVAEFIEMTNSWMEVEAVAARIIKETERSKK